MRLLTGFLSCSALLYGSLSPAQELEPRFYTNLPVDMNFIAVGFARSAGGVLFDPSIELDNADLVIDGPYIGYARSLGIGGRSGKVDIGIANVCLDGSADFEGQPASRSVCGWSDARLRLAINFIGAPALAMKDFVEYRQTLVVGASLALNAPIGDYESDKLVNIGSNRWAAKAELGASRTFQQWVLELTVSSTFFEDNDDFFGGLHREQKPINALQAHLVRRFASGAWLAADYTRYRGGETATDGLPNANLQSNARVGVTLSVPITRQQTLKLNGSSGVLTRTGSDFDTLGITWMYAWGN